MPVTLLAFDGNSILNRAFYGIRPLTTKEGINTNAVYGFLNILLRHLQDLPEAKIAVAFDRREKTFRHNLYTGYKATRKQMPEELAQQLPIIKAVIEDLQGTGVCNCTSVSATPVNWVLDRILGKL